MKATFSRFLDLSERYRGWVVTKANRELHRDVTRRFIEHERRAWWSAYESRQARAASALAKIRNAISSPAA